MAIAESDLEYRISGGANNESPAAALGGAMSTKAAGVITTEELNNIFDDVSGDEGKAGDVEYRGFYIKNKHATLTLTGAKLWITQDADSADDATAIALSDEAVNEALETIANESTAPSGPTFTAPTTKEAGLSIGNIPAGQYRGIWVRRTITAGAAAKNKVTFKVRVEGDSAE
jgi:hypothetical protein